MEAVLVSVATQLPHIEVKVAVLQQNPVCKDERLCQSVWRIDTVAVPLIRPRILVQDQEVNLSFHTTITSE